MAFQTRRPPIQMELDKLAFNKLVELLNHNISNFNAQISEDATKLKDKLLRYSVPKEKDGIDYIKFGFFPIEASETILQMITFIEEKTNINPVCDYHKVLLNIRAERQKKKEDK